MVRAVDAESLRRDGRWIARVMPVVSALITRYFRSEVVGADNLPDGAALIVSNHSGGLLTVDVPIVVDAFVRQHGPDAPLYVLAHDLILTGPQNEVFARLGFLRAARGVAAAALAAGAAVLVFPGGDHEAYRSTAAGARIDFGGRTGYVRTALAAGVPIVPVVSIGGQESQLFLGRIHWIAEVLRLPALLRIGYVPITLGLPFGLTAGVPPNFPLPTKIVTAVLPPIDPWAEFGPDPEVAAVDQLVRDRMQEALDDLARRRRLPVIG